jgi:hypothetical protein
LSEAKTHRPNNAAGSEFILAQQSAALLGKPVPLNYALQIVHLRSVVTAR